MCMSLSATNRPFFVTTALLGRSKLVKRSPDVHSRSRATVSNVFCALTTFSNPPYGAAFLTMGVPMTEPERPILHHLRALCLLIGLAGAAALAGCGSSSSGGNPPPPDDPTVPAAYVARGSVQQVYVVDAEPGQVLSLVDGAGGAGRRAGTADDQGTYIFRDVAPGARLHRARRSPAPTPPRATRSR